MTDLIRHRSQPDSQRMDAQPSRFHPAVLAAISAAMLFGASTPFTKVLLGHTSPEFLAGLLYLQEVPCFTPESVPIGKTVRYRIPLVANVRRFLAGHRVQLIVTSDDQDPAVPAMLTYRHASVGTSSFNTTRSTSRLILPVLDDAHRGTDQGVVLALRTGQATENLV